MKKPRNNSIKAMLFGLLLCLTAALLPGVKGEAAAKKPTCPKKKTIYMIQADKNYYMTIGNSLIGENWIYINNVAPNAKITNLKFSNKHMSGYAVEYYKKINGDYVEYPAIYVDAKGSVKDTKITGKVTFKVKQNGKTYPLSCTVTLKRFNKCFFREFRIDGKNYASRTTGNWCTYLKLPTNRSVKISVKGNPSSGEKITGISLNDKKIKNGSKVKLKSGDYIAVSFKDIKTGISSGVIGICVL